MARREFASGLVGAVPMERLVPGERPLPESVSVVVERLSDNGATEYENQSTTSSLPIVVEMVHEPRLVGEVCNLKNQTSDPVDTDRESKEEAGQVHEVANVPKTQWVPPVLYEYMPEDGLFVDQASGKKYGHEASVFEALRQYDQVKAKREEHRALREELEEMRAEQAAQLSILFKNPLETEAIQKEGVELHPGLVFLDALYANSMVYETERYADLGQEDFSASMADGFLASLSEDEKHHIANELKLHGTAEVENALSNPAALYELRLLVPSLRDAYIRKYLLPNLYISILQDAYTEREEQRLVQERQWAKVRRLPGVLRLRKPTLAEERVDQIERQMQDDEVCHAVARDRLKSMLDALSERQLNELYQERDYKESFWNFVRFLGVDLRTAHVHTNGYNEETYSLQGLTGDASANDSIRIMTSKFEKRRSNIGDPKTLRVLGVVVRGASDRPLDGGFIVEARLETMQLNFGDESKDSNAYKMVDVVVRHLTEKAMNSALDSLISNYAPQGSKPYLDVLNQVPELFVEFMDEYLGPRISDYWADMNRRFEAARPEFPELNLGLPSLRGLPPAGQ